MKLNGWHRLWIVLSVVYFILVTSFVILEFQKAPKAEKIPHQSEFYKKLSKKTAAMIWPTNYEDALALGGEDLAKLANISPNISFFDEVMAVSELKKKVDMPNGHTIGFKEKISEEDMRLVSQEYWRVVEWKATEKKLHLLLYAFLFWLGPCMGLYAFGWSVNWVYKGFKKKDAQQSHPADSE